MNFDKLLGFCYEKKELKEHGSQVIYHNATFTGDSYICRHHKSFECTCSWSRLLASKGEKTRTITATLGGCAILKVEIEFRDRAPPRNYEKIGLGGTIVWAFVWSHGRDNY